LTSRVTTDFSRTLLHGVSNWEKTTNVLEQLVSCALNTFILKIAAVTSSSTSEASSITTTNLFTRGTEVHCSVVVYSSLNYTFK